MVDALRKRIKQLEKENKQLESALEDAYGYKKKYYEIKHCKVLAEKLKEALQKCDPRNKSVFCVFCGNRNFHQDDCEYVQLIKESEDK